MQKSQVVMNDSSPQNLAGHHLGTDCELWRSSRLPQLAALPGQGVGHDQNAESRLHRLLHSASSVYQQKQLVIICPSCLLRCHAQDLMTYVSQRAAGEKHANALSQIPCTGFDDICIQAGCWAEVCEYAFTHHRWACLSCESLQVLTLCLVSMRHQACSGMVVILNNEEAKQGCS